MKRRLCWVLLHCLASGAASAGERHALLIGVGELPALPRAAWLAGPVNDVAAMRAALRQQGFAERHIDSLSDGGAFDAAPTRAAILARLAQLKKTLGKDDVLLLYWSGHSVLAPGYPGAAAQPQRTRLLTRDSRPGPSKQLDGGIGSTELGRAIDALSARQVQVVAVFDTCHAAAGTRSDDGLHWRGLSASEIGWRQSAGNETGAGPGSEPARARPRFVGFFAAEAQQRTPEARSVTAPGQAAGLFTRAVIAGLQAQPATYAAWAGNASAQYRAALQSYQLPRSAWPSPVYAGLLDASLWHAGENAHTAPLWPVQRDAQGWKLPHGLLDGVRSGDLFEAGGTRWRASEVGWNGARLVLAADSRPTLPAMNSMNWARRTPAQTAQGRIAALLALPPSPGAPLLDARIELTLPGQAPRQLPLADGDLGTLPAGTRIRISVENRGAASVDLGLAHLPLHGAATSIYPALAGDSNRMPPASGNAISVFERSFVVSGPAYGVEWLVLVAAPAVNGAPPRRFAILEALPAATRGGPDLAPSGTPEQAQLARVSWKSVP
ncbi:caspase family protein [Janthinobacterium sp. RB2R34]|uniref:caspase family protein n=1 Tax=Janthinobacterium sp. RB2R34 TaxID=3424193 RepID=UPI003F1FF7D1